MEDAVEEAGVCRKTEGECWRVRSADFEVLNTANGGDFSFDVAGSIAPNILPNVRPGSVSEDGRRRSHGSEVTHILLSRVDPRLVG